MNELNQRLYELYKKLWPQFEKLMCKQGKDISDPHFIWVPDAYLKSQCRLLVVGQEPRGWIGTYREKTVEDPVLALMEMAGKYQEKHEHGTWIFQISGKLQASLNPVEPANSYVWANLLNVCKQVCDSGTRPDKEVEEIVSGWELLPKELRILEPHVVVFLIGKPDSAYGGRLSVTLPGIRTSLLVEGLWKAEHPLFRGNAFVTYNRYLRPSGLEGSVLAKIVEHVTGT